MSRLEELIAQAQEGDKAASEILVTENSGLIWSIARRFLGRGVDGDDLYQLGCLGFLKAVAGFDLEYGTQFSTYAVPKISGEIRRFLRDDGAVKVSRTIKEQAATIKIARRMIREIDEAKDIPVVFLTGVSDKSHIEAVLKLKPAGYLLKPADASRIYGLIEEILG